MDRSVTMHNKAVVGYGMVFIMQVFLASMRQPEAQKEIKLKTA